jgi:hypothetical protein
VRAPKQVARRDEKNKDEEAAFRGKNTGKD